MSFLKVKQSHDNLIKKGKLIQIYMTKLYANVYDKYLRCSLNFLAAYMVMWKLIQFVIEDEAPR